MAALMTSDFDNTDRLAIEIAECKHMGIEVLPPDVNESFLEFGVVDASNQIRFGMAAIKNVGAGAVEEILRAREIDGQFKSLEDFLSKVSLRVVNRKALDSLIKAGAFDRFRDRSLLVNNIDVLLAYANRLQKEASSGQTDLFGGQMEASPTAPQLVFQENVTLYSPNEQLQWERQLLGLYLSQHPLAQYELFLAEQTMGLHDLTAEVEGQRLTVGGAVQDIREITTKNGQRMAFIKIADQFGEIELVLFPSVYQQTVELWQRDQVVIASGKVTSRDRSGNKGGDLKMLVDDAKLITPEQAAAYQPTGKKPRVSKAPKSLGAAVATAVANPPTTLPRIYIRLDDGQNSDLLVSLKQTIDGYRGDTEVVLVLGDTAQKQIIKLPMKINNDKTAMSRLQALVGTANVKIQ
jgi:DNA polymerase-3 subunit alpha